MWGEDITGVQSIKELIKDIMTPVFRLVNVHYQQGLVNTDSLEVCVYECV